MSTPSATTTGVPIEGASIEVVNARTGQAVGAVSDMGVDDVRKVVDRARQAQVAWASAPLRARVEVVRSVRRAVARRRAEVREVLVAESGKAWEDAQADLVLVLAGMAHWERHARAALADEPLSTRGVWGLGRRAARTFRPHGVVGVVGPWNFPLGLTFGDAVPALLAGNAAVLKPSEVTPLSTTWIAQVWLEEARRSGLGEDALQVVTGGPAAGAALVEEVDMVQFTGSVATGRRIAHACVDAGIPYSLELGGKDPWIVLADADLDRVAAAATHHAMFNGGQVCMSAERLYVEESVHDDLVARLVQRVDGLRLAPSHADEPARPGRFDVAPAMTAKQGEIVQAHIADALDKGATAVIGGLSDDPARPLPTVLVEVDHAMACMREETFGPTLPVMAVRDAEQAVALANDSAYGLTASVWTRDLARGRDLARRIDAGTVSVNDAVVHLGIGHLPMGGHRASGTGVRNGVEGIHKYTRATVVVTNRSPLTRELAWLPYGELPSRVLDTAIGLLYRR